MFYIICCLLLVLFNTRLNIVNTYWVSAFIKNEFQNGTWIDQMREKNEVAFLLLDS